MNNVSGFKRDERGSVTIQVMFFSLMVFGATGIVLDAGRVYDSHSRMQIYADHLALIAANELDGKEDSIARATSAVFGAEDTGSQVLSGQDANAEYTIDQVAFYSGMAESTSVQNDMSEAFPSEFLLAQSSGGTTNAVPGDSQAATHVMISVSANVNAITKSLTQTIVDIGKPHDTKDIGADEIGPSNFDLSAVSAATMERQACADLSTLVMCNPWEDQDNADTVFDDEDSQYSIPGRSLMHFAPNFLQNGVPADGIPADRIIVNGEEHGSLFPWDLHHQLFQIDAPVSDPATVCSGDFLRDLQGRVLTDGASSADYMAARDRCLMARAVSPNVCWSNVDPLSIRPADGDTVLRSINTIFDIWNPPFDTMIQDPRVLGEVVVPVGGTNQTRSVRFADFVAPDILATTTYETADRFGVDDDDDATEPKIMVDTPDGPVEMDADWMEEMVQDGIPDYNMSWPHDNPFTNDGDASTNIDVEDDPDNYVLDAFQPAYDTIPKPGWSYVAGTRGEGIGYDYCHDKTLGRQDTARQELRLCLADSTDTSQTPTEQAAIEAQCEADYIAATTFDTCAADNPGREREACGCSIDFVGDHHQGNPAFYMYARTLPNRGRYYSFNGVSPNVALPISPISGPNSWYDYYTLERDMQKLYPSTQVTTQADRSRVARWDAEAVTKYNLTEDPIELDGASILKEGYLKHYPDDFLARTGRTPAHDAGFNAESEFIDPWNRERRRIRAAMVNCGVVTGTLADADGSSRSANDSGSFDVMLDDMRVMDAYIPNPAGIFCGYNDVSCQIEDSIETTMYIELIEDVTEEATSRQYTVMLVR